MRDFNTIGKRERMTANVAALVTGTSMVIGMDRLNGVSLGQSITGIGLALIVGTVISYCYLRYRKREYMQDRRVVCHNPTIIHPGIEFA